MTIIGAGQKGAKLDGPTLIDFLQFIDGVVEVHGDPFYELRYRCARRAAQLTERAASTHARPRRYLFRLIDLDNSDSLQDEEIEPLLKAAGLSEPEAKAAVLRLLGDQLMVRLRRASALFTRDSRWRFRHAADELPPVCGRHGGGADHGRGIPAGAA